MYRPDQQELSNANAAASNVVESVQRTVSSNIPGLDYQEVPGDGHCLFHAVGLYLGQDQAFLRRIVAAHIEHNLASFREFISLPRGQTHEGYLQAVREGQEWADDIEIEVLMRITKRPIVVIGPETKIRNQMVLERGYTGEPIFVFYNGHNHYNAYLLKAGASGQDVINYLTHFNEHPHVVIDPESLQVAAPVQPNNAARVVDLSRSFWHTAITAKDLHRYIHTDRYFSRLIAINLMYTGLGDALIPALATALEDQTCTVRILHLGYNDKLTPIGVQQIAKALERNRSLVSLEFQQNTIGDVGAEGIARMLERNPILVSLGLNGRHFPRDVKTFGTDADISLRGAQHLAHALNPTRNPQANRTLKELSLWGNNLGDDGMDVVADMLMYNSSLEFLGLGRNGLTDKSGTHLHRALTHNRTLTSLDLRVNGLCDKGIHTLAPALAANPRIITINLIENGLRDPILINPGSGLITLLRANRNSMLVYVALQPGDLGEISASPQFGVKEYLMSWVPPIGRWSRMAAGAASAITRVGGWTSIKTVGEHAARYFSGWTNKFSSEHVNTLRLICQENFSNYLANHLSPEICSKLDELDKRRKNELQINEAWVDKTLLDQEHTTSVVSSLRSREKVLFAIVARNPDSYNSYIQAIKHRFATVYTDLDQRDKEVDHLRQELADIEARCERALQTALRYKNENETIRRMFEAIEQQNIVIDQLKTSIAVLSAKLKSKYQDSTFVNLATINLKSKEDPDFKTLEDQKRRCQELINRKNQDIETLLKRITEIQPADSSAPASLRSS